MATAQVLGQNFNCAKRVRLKLESRQVTNTLVTLTGVVASVHVAVVVAHGVQVVQEVIRVPAQAVGPPPRRPVGGQAPAALAPLDHVRRHVHAHQREAHHVLHLHPEVALLDTGRPAIREDNAFRCVCTCAVALDRPTPNMHSQTKKKPSGFLLKAAG